MRVRWGIHWNVEMLAGSVVMERVEYREGVFDSQCLYDSSIVWA